MILLLFTIFLSTVVHCDEIITLEDQKHFLCATDNQDSAIFVTPPVIEEAKDSSLLLEDDKRWSDNWILKNSTDVIVSFVTDKRWQDFGIIFTNEIHFDSVLSLSFSSYGSNSMNITVANVETPALKKRDIFLYWAHHQTHAASKIDRFQITAKTPENSWWRLHSYKLRWAETVSEEPTTILVSKEDTPCLILYVYVCSHCILNVRASGFTYIFYGKHGETSDSLEDWQSFKITVESQRGIRLERNTTNGQPEGQWGIDIRQCPVMKSNRTIYDVQLHDNDLGKDRSCNVLKSSTVINDKSIFECKAGTLGANCDVKCEDLLGSENNYCQKHKVCDSSSSTNQICLCAWGYKGALCNETCSAGEWGLSCQKKCDCESCNSQSGYCSSSAFSPYSSRGLEIIISLGIGIILLK